MAQQGAMTPSEAAIETYRVLVSCSKKIYRMGISMNSTWNLWFETTFEKKGRVPSFWQSLVEFSLQQSTDFREAFVWKHTRAQPMALFQDLGEECLRSSQLHTLWTCLTFQPF